MRKSVTNPGTAKKVSSQNTMKKNQTRDANAVKKALTQDVKEIQVDFNVPNSQSYKVHSDGAVVCSIYLMWSDLAKNNNKFYLIQLLSKGSKLYEWVRYGRVGYTGQTTLKDTTLTEGVKQFHKTVNAKQKKGYTEIKMALGKPKDPSTADSAKTAEFEDSTLPKKV